MVDQKDANDGLTVGPTKVTPSRRPSRPGYRQLGQDRDVKHYSLSSTEVLFLSVVNPIAAVLIGAGVNIWMAWTHAPKDAPMRDLAWLCSVLLLGAGGVLVVLTWTFFFVMLYQSRTGSWFAWLPAILKRAASVSPDDVEDD